MVKERLDYLEIAGDEPVLRGEFTDHTSDTSLHGGRSDSEIITAIERYSQTIDATVTRAEWAASGGDGGSGTTIPDTIHIDEFGADPTGGSPSDAALDDAVSAAREGDIIAITNGTYYFANRHTFYKSVILDGTGSRIESDCHTTEGSVSTTSSSDPYQSQHYFPLFKFQGDKGSHVGVSASADRGSDQVAVSSTASFSVGDGVIIANQQTNSAVMDRDYTPTVSRIREIENGVLYLSKSLKYNIDTTFYAAPVTFLERPTIRNMSIYPRTEPTFDPDMGRVMGGPQHIFATQWTRNAFIDNCYIDTFGSNVYSSSDCVDAVIRDVHAGEPMNLSGSSGEAYYINGSSDITLIRPTVEGCRRAVDIRSGCRTLYTIDPRISGVSLGAISFHSGGGLNVQGRQEVRGGYIHCRMEDPTMDNKDGSLDQRQEYQSGTLFRGMHEGVEIVVEGTELVANRQDENTQGTIKMSNCRIVKPSDGYTGISPIELGNGDFTFTDCEFDVVGANALTAIGTSGSVKLDNVTSNAAIDLSGGSHGDYWFGIVEAPSVTAGSGTGTVVHNPYNV